MTASEMGCVWKEGGGGGDKAVNYCSNAPPWVGISAQALFRYVYLDACM